MISFKKKEEKTLFAGSFLTLICENAPDKNHDPQNHVHVPTIRGDCVSRSNAKAHLSSIRSINVPGRFPPFRCVPLFSLPWLKVVQNGTLIAGGGPHARTREGRGCRPHGLIVVKEKTNVSIIFSLFEIKFANREHPLITHPKAGRWGVLRLFDGNISYLGP